LVIGNIPPKKEERVKHYNVVIAVPGANFLQETIVSLMKTAERLQEEGITFKFVNGYSSIVSEAREITLLDGGQLNYEDTVPFGGKFTYDKLFWIDSDMLWTPQYFIDLYNSDKDAIAGVFVNTKMEPMFFFDNKKDEARKLEFLKKTKPFKVLSFGMAFVCMKQGIIESIDRPWFEFGAMIKTTESGKEYREIVGEDLMFCMKMNDAGFELYVDPNVRIGHMKIRALGISK
jgi:hypothetical protein